jgi:hypothetical protein
MRDLARGQQRTVATGLCGLSGLGHLSLDLGHCADAEANHFGDFVDTDTFGQLGSCLVQLLWISTRTAEALFDFAMFRDEVAPYA